MTLLAVLSGLSTKILKGLNATLTLALQVQEVLRKDPLSGHLFVFRGRRSDLVKVI
ncbi:IS66 family insertion sequence element accessory protein TnpB [Bradyrhizobium sp. 33ap4]|uniref:IS66 family insertion sequence element accessory protein TnpB n=1 Tax=Bradyrhizobium sp. 33ap4 TaxID=3061630 RepID=UPI0029309439|nr:IS66 family insertion sequence element accessory protein TnpB [Bradyrhizobium sp. 33ap4]